MRSFLLALAFFLSIFELFGQQRLHLSDHQVVISGTSSMHDWAIIAQSMQFTGKMICQDDGMISFEDITVQIKVDSLKNDKGSMVMDQNTQLALRSGLFQDIVFRPSGNLKGAPISEHAFEISGSAELSIAGIKREMQVAAKGQWLSESQFSISGSSDLLMSDFDIKPPKSRLGTLQTDDLVTIDYRLKFWVGEVTANHRM